MLRSNIQKCEAIFDKDALAKKIKLLQEKTMDENFWNDNLNAQKILKKISMHESEVKMWMQLESYYSEVDLYLTLLDEGEEIEVDASGALDEFIQFLSKVEISDLKKRQNDNINAKLEEVSGLQEELEKQYG